MGKIEVDITPYQFNVLDTSQSFIILGHEVANAFAEKLYSMGFEKYWFAPIDDWEFTKQLITMPKSKPSGKNKNGLG